MLDWANALCAADEAEFDKFITDTKPAFAHLFKEYNHMGATPPNPARDFVSTEEKALCRQLGIDPKDLIKG